MSMEMGRFYNYQLEKNKFIFQNTASTEKFPFDPSPQGTKIIFLSRWKKLQGVSNELNFSIPIDCTEHP